MNRLAITVGIAALMIARVAIAQTGEIKIGYQGLPVKQAAETPSGIQLGEGVMMHVGAGAETGYDTNVFYQDANKTTSGLLRATAYASITNSTRTGQAAGAFNFSGGAGLTYRRYLTDNPTVDPIRNAWMPNAHLVLGGSSGQLAFGFSDTFIRIEDAPYTPLQLPYIRNANTAAAEIRWSPGGGRIAGTLRYTNLIDILENEYSYANSLTHNMMLDVSWKWLPKTAVFLQANQGWVTYLQPDASDFGKVSSFPLRIFAGLRGLITPKTQALVAFGYLNGFYSSGATTNGIWGSTYALAQVTMTPTLLSRVILGARHDFVNSVIGNFYYDDSVYASYVQQIGGRFAIDLSGRYAFRSYEGYIVQTPAGPVTEPREDNVLVLGATLDYFVRNWIYAGVGYSMAANFTDSTYATPVGPISLDYVKQQVFARLGVTY